VILFVFRSVGCGGNLLDSIEFLVVLCIHQSCIASATLLDTHTHNMDELVDALLNIIALEGLAGCSFNRMWELLEIELPFLSPIAQGFKIDHFSKPILWRFVQASDTFDFFLVCCSRSGAR
jgi:hypothetical protein